MPPERQVYLLDPQKLPPETIAVTFAKTSRSPQSFRAIAAELTDEKSAEFHEKWVVGYGHASVAEHAVLHVAVENISRLAVETLESNRLASYTEKSTRYQRWDRENFFIPPELDKHPLRPVYVDICTRLFDAYEQSLPAVKAILAVDNPPEDGESEARWDRRVRSDYVDVCRFFLPAASLANVGMTLNARALEHAISKMLSHPLQEVQALGAEIKDVSKVEVPTLVKYADPLPYLINCRKSLEDVVGSIPNHSSSKEWCRLVSCREDGEERVLAAALYRFGELSYTQAIEYVCQLAKAERAALAERLLGNLGRHDIPLRELEYATYTFDVLLDQGAYFELKRHRMMTQTPQPLTTHQGYAMPKRLVRAGLEDLFRELMEAAAEAHEQLARFNPEVASYVVPNAYNRRVLIETNLRSAAHLVNLRTAENAHFSIRRIARRMAEQIQECTPLLGKYLRLPESETWQQIEENYFTQV
jgi:thymidylate synthase ThyX